MENSEENLEVPNRRFSWPTKKELSLAIHSFSKKEVFIFVGFMLALCVTTVAILQNINRHFMVSVPIQGGAVTEGVVGTPRFANPVLAFSEADRDIISLVYSGLMRKMPDGSLVPDLAESYVVSADGLTYTFTLRSDIYFHDGRPVTPDDIVFTVAQVKDPLIKSPRKGNWDGVEVAKVDERTVAFTLREPFASFLENSTLGILPSHIWNISSPIELNEANTHPVGSGPYAVKNVGQEETGTITFYELEAFNKFALGKPHIKTITLRFYQNEEEMLSALEQGEVNQLGSITPGSAETLKEQGYRVESSTLPRVFGLFFNQSQNQLFIDKNIVRSIDLAIDKERIVNEVLLGYGVVIDDPIPPNMIGYQRLAAAKNENREEVLAGVRESLEKDGWTLGESGYLEKTVTENGKKVVKILEFSISTGSVPELAKTATLIQEDLEEIGMKVDVKTFEVGNLNQSVIRPRKYDALLFGQIINNESDLFAFWHSSQRLDPGLNVALYTNSKVDKILEDAFIITDPTERAKKYAEFETEIRNDLPAVFVYSPSFIYVVDREVKGFSIDHITSPSARFVGSYLWYIKIDNIWKIFSND